MRKRSMLLVLAAAVAAALLFFVALSPTAPDHPPAPSPADTVREDPRDQPEHSEAGVDLRDDSNLVNIRGVVLRAADYSPVPYARVQVGEGPFEQVIETDADGQWALSAPRTLFLVVRATAPGFLPCRRSVRFPVGVDVLSAPPILLSEMSARIVVLVENGSGEPVAGARVRFDLADGTPWKSVTDVQGRAGPFETARRGGRVRAVSDQHSRGERWFRLDKRSPEDVTELVIRLGEADFATGITVDGAGEPIAGVRLAADDQWFAVSGEDGRFRFPLAPSESERVSITKKGYSPIERRVRLHAGSESRIVLSPTVTIDGVVLRHDDRPGAGLKLSFKHEDLEDAIESATDGNGRFSGVAIPPGTIMCSVNGNGAPLGDVPLEVPDRPPEPGLTLRLPPPEFVTLFVTDAKTGAPVPGVRWTLHDKALTSTSRDETDEAGSARIPYRCKGVFWAELTKVGYLPGKLLFSPLGETAPLSVALEPGARVRFRVTDPESRPVEAATLSFDHPDLPRQRSWTNAEGYAEILLPPDVLVVVDVMRADLGGSRLRLTAPGGEVTGPIEVQLGGAETTTTLTVTDESGNPIPGARACLQGSFGGGRNSHWIAADANGRLAFPAAGWSHVSVIAPGRELRVLYLGDLADTVESPIVLRPSGAIRIRVVDPSDRPVPGVVIRVEHDEREFDLRTDGAGRAERDWEAAGECYSAEFHAPPPVSVTFLETQIEVSDREIVVRYPGTARVKLISPPTGFNGRTEVIAHRVASEALEVTPAVTRSGNEATFALPAGRYALEVSGSSRPGCIVFDVDLPADAETSLDCGLGSSGGLTGTVRGEDGSPLPETRIECALTGRTVGKTDETGRIIAESEPLLGIVPLLVRHNEHAPYFTDPVDLAKGAHITVRLVRGVQVSGTVIRGVGVDVGGRIRFRTPAGPQGRWRRVTRKGQFSFLQRVAPGRQILEYRPYEGLPSLHPVDIPNEEWTEVEIR